MMWPPVMSICWMSGVESDGACRQRSQRAAISPPVRPVKPTRLRPRSRAAPIALRMFGERPEVEIAINTGAPEAEDLPLEHALIAVIVADRGLHRTVGRQRDRRCRAAVVIEPRQHFAGEVLRIAGAAAVAAEQELIAGCERPRRNLGDVADRVREGGIVDRRVEDSARLFEIAPDRAHRRCSHPFPLHYRRACRCIASPYRTAVSSLRFAVRLDRRPPLGPLSTDRHIVRRHQTRSSGLHPPHRVHFTPAPV